ncbi:DUF3313 domain-containing protein [Dyadobacter sp. CY351]|uniref:DUF3313 domain-containing protein n=1 Tax=Dyadobacter sp. CY351 TaxID=2909337 RepID=UPI001F36B97E|nr:DUF3313 domain-containing protein [Dyadobacter sp. CY351]MCF2516039.1 DUF3313 domain-containing protein [Dyadobacter sp. CY351]
MDTTKNSFSALQRAIARYESNEALQFRPTKVFYDNVGINRIRFWQLAKGQKEMLVSEARRLSTYFRVPLEEFLKKESPETTSNSPGQNAMA